MQLLSFQFREFSPILALEILHSAIARQSKNADDASLTDLALPGAASGEPEPGEGRGVRRASV